MAQPPIEASLESGRFDCTELHVYSVTGREQLAQPFRFDVALVSTADKALALDDMVGGEVTVVFRRGGDVLRRVHGIVTEAEQLPELGQGLRAYRVAVGPRLLRAGFVTNFKVHVDLSIRDLIVKRLGLLGLDEGPDFQLHLEKPLPVRRLVVQYRETDFAFLSRILEQYGLCYFFAQEGDRDCLVISDNPSGFDDLGQVGYRGRGERSDVFAIAHVRRLIPKGFVCRDHNYKTPQVRVQSDRVVLDEGDFGGVFDYGSHVTSVDEANSMARQFADRALAERDVYSGQSDQAPFAPGKSFLLAEREDVPRLLLVSVEHELQQAAPGNPSGGRAYHNLFRAIPNGRMYRPPLTTPLPRIAGLVHAVVQTDAAGTIAKRPNLDGEGRYLVKFRFDASATESSEAASCRVRMLQPSAGPGYGMHFPLRPGVEVMCAFVDGNPDRPVIVGAAPNPLSPSPVTASAGNKNRIATGSGALIEFEDG